MQGVPAQAVYTHPPHGQVHAQPIAGQAPVQAMYAQPAHGQPGYFQPAPYQVPGQAAYGQPMPGQAAYVQPVYAQPGMPVYGQPVAQYPPLHDDKHAVRMGNFVFLGSYGKIRAVEICDGGMCMDMVRVGGRGRSKGDTGRIISEELTNIQS